MRIAILLTAICLLSAPAVQAEILVKVVAVVNDDIVTSYQLDGKVESVREEMAAKGQSLEEAELRKKVLEGLVEELLLKQRASEIGLAVGDEEIDAAIDDILRQNEMTLEQLQAALKGQGIDFDQYRQNLTGQILRYKIVGREVQSKAEVTTEQLRSYYREHVEDYRRAPFVSLSRLAVTPPEKASPEVIEAARLKAQQAKAALSQGEEFAAVVERFADDPQVKGGEMGSFRRGELAPVFDQAIADLQAGQSSEVVEFGGGFYLFVVDQRNEGELRLFEDVKGEISVLMQEQVTQERYVEWQKELKEKAFIDIRID